MMRGVKVELPEAAQARWNQLQIARHDAEDAGRSAANRLNNLPRDADRELVAGWTAKRDSCNARHQQLSRLVNMVNEWPMKLPANAVLQLSPGITIALKDKQTLADAIASARDDIAGLQQQLAITARAPLPLEDQMQLAEAFVEQQARTARPTTIAVVRDQLRVTFRDDIVTSRSDVLALMCWAAPEHVLATLQSEIEAQPTAINPMSAQERTARISQIQAQLGELEQLEEGLIIRAEAEGLDVLRRPEASPAVVLGVTIKPKAQASSQVA
jgi:hypothetical protein